MKMTKATIKKGLPRITYLRRWYRLQGTTGIIYPGTMTFMCAFIDLDDGLVTVYGYGDGISERHLYLRNCVDITDIMVDWLRGEIDRGEVVDMIQTLVRRA